MCEKTGRWREAVQIFGSFVSKGGIVEEDLVEPLLRVCLEAGETQRVQQYLKELDILFSFVPSFKLSKYVALRCQRAAKQD